MSIYNRTSCFFSRLKYHTNTTLNHHIKMRSGTSGTYAHSTLNHHMKMRSGTSAGFVDTSIWKKLNSTTVGITRSLIPLPTWIVLNVLHRGGFEAYLVGGCVRDLVLNRTPKDFDVVTNANLKQIKKLYRRAFIVGCRFPICIVHVRGSVIEVSSFGTVAGNATQKKEANFTEGRRGCDEEDFVRWRDCMRRDFTINSLLFDPFANKIYDYAGGMEDLKSLKLRTLVPAQLSFKEDCARILRGLRIAARLGLTFSEDTETAICSLSPSIMGLSKSRIMMELNYMLSYGAAGPSICLLQRFNLLELLLPLQATYLAQQPDKETAKCSTMLMKLFSNLDKLLHCDRPSDCILWLGLLAFHQALVNKPQDALVICTFSSVLHRGGWVEGVKFAREHAEAHVSFVPEVLEVCHHKSDEELAEEIMQLASLVNNSINALTGTQILSKSISGYQSFPHPGLVFVSKKMANNVARIFEVMLNDIEYYEEQRKSLDIDYGLLGKGDPSETRFVIGKIIVDTMMGEEVIQGITDTAEGQRQQQKEVSPVLQQLGEDNNHHINVSNPLKNAVDVKEFGKPTVSADAVPKHKEPKVSGVEAKEIGQCAHSSPRAIRKHKKKHERRIKNGSKRVRKCGLSQSSAAVPDFTEKKIVTSGLKIEEDEKQSLTPSSAVPKQKNGGKVDVKGFGKSTVSADAVPKHKKPKVSGAEAKEIGQRAHSSPSAIPKHKKPKVSGVEAKENRQCAHSSPSAIPKHKKPKVSGVEAKDIGQGAHSSPSAIPKHKKPKVSGVEAKDIGQGAHSSPSAISKHKKPKVSGVEAKEIGQCAHSSPSAIPKHKKPKVSGVEAKEIGQRAHSSPSAIPKHKKPNVSGLEAKEIGQCANSSPSAIPKHKKKQESGVKNGRKRVRKRGLSQSSAPVPDVTEKKMVTSGLKIEEDEKESLTPSSAVPKQKSAGKVDEGGQGGTISPSIGVRKGKKQDLSKNVTQDLPKKTKSEGGAALLFSLFR